MSTIQKIARLAHQIFSKEGRSVDKTKYHEVLTSLREAMSQLRISDLGITEQDLCLTPKTRNGTNSPSFMERLWDGITGQNGSNSRKLSDSGVLADRFIDMEGSAPCRFIEVYKCEDFIINVFILTGAGRRIPIHDHRFMQGMIGVLSGDIRIRSWSYLPNLGENEDEEARLPEQLEQSITKRYSDLRRLFPTQNLEPVIVEPESKLSASREDVAGRTATLNHQEGNIHEITAMNGPAAFLDILAPPYSEENDCQYFHELPNIYDIDEKSAGRKKIVWLTHSQPPSSFWCVDLPYRGPDLKIENGFTP